MAPSTEQTKIWLGWTAKEGTVQAGAFEPGQILGALHHSQGLGRR